MEYEIKARISNRHVHLTKEAYDKLFSQPLTKKNDLNQVGEFAANEKVNIKIGDKEIKNVRIVGPLRTYNQVEISMHDARTLGVKPPVRRSGDLKDSLEVVIETEKGSIKTNGLIIANRHIHMTPELAKKYNVKDYQKVKVKVGGDKSGIMDAEIKVSDNGYLELHIDTDDANAFLLNDNDDVIMII